MATYRDAVRRLQIIYNECNPQSNQNKKDVDKSADEFTQLKKELHLEVKQIRLVRIRAHQTIISWLLTLI
jgi:hypothetical protein